MATQDLAERPQLRTLDASQRSGSIGMVLLVALVRVAAALGLPFIGRAHAENYILFLLAALAVVGVFSLFAGAAGILRMPGKDGAADPLLKMIIESAPDGIAVTDPAGQVVIANSAYLAMIDAADEKEVRPVERVFVGDPDVSEAVYR